MPHLQILEHSIETWRIIVFYYLTIREVYDAADDRSQNSPNNDGKQLTAFYFPADLFHGIFFLRDLHRNDLFHGSFSQFPAVLAVFEVFLYFFS